MLQPVFKDGKLLVDWTLDEIRQRVKEQSKEKEVQCV